MSDGLAMNSNQARIRPEWWRPVQDFAMSDACIDAFLRNVLRDEGAIPDVVRANTWRRLAAVEQVFRDQEVIRHRKAYAAKRGRALCRARVAEELSRCKGTRTEAHLRIVLSAFDGPA
jgi:hypothetical protein